MAELQEKMELKKTGDSQGPQLLFNNGYELPPPSIEIEICIGDPNLKRSTISLSNTQINLNT